MHPFTFSHPLTSRATLNSSSYPLSKEAVQTLTEPECLLTSTDGYVFNDIRVLCSSLICCFQVLAQTFLTLLWANAMLYIQGYAANRAGLILPNRAANISAGRPITSEGGNETVYFCCVDGDGNGCSMINRWDTLDTFACRLNLDCFQVATIQTRYLLTPCTLAVSIIIHPSPYFRQLYHKGREHF